MVRQHVTVQRKTILSAAEKNLPIAGSPASRSRSQPHVEPEMRYALRVGCTAAAARLGKGREPPDENCMGDCFPLTCPGWAGASPAPNV